MEDGERRAAATAVQGTIARIAKLHFTRQEDSTDLPGCLNRAALDSDYLSGHRTLIIASDLIGNVPGSDGARLSLHDMSVDIFLYCSSRWIDSAHSCAQRRDTWQSALTHAGATDVHWFSSDNLDTVDHV